MKDLLNIVTIKFKVGDKVSLKSRASAVDGFSYYYGDVVKVYKITGGKVVNVVRTKIAGTSVDKFVAHDNTDLDVYYRCSRGNICDCDADDGVLSF
mgnify:FL=1|tara:strand:- start:467 stop:754 length:288 start_codon:yes stop_codon:yes gene_type:complete